MPRTLGTHAKPLPEPPRSRLRPRRMCPSNIQLQASPQKLLTVAEKERLLRVNLPTELWKEVIRHAVSVEHEFETCGFDGGDYTLEHSASYIAEWFRASQTRLSLVLVCKAWNNLASEYLYRSILITHACSARKFIRLLLRRLVNNGMTKYVRRVSVYPFDGSKALKLSLRNAIAQFPNLRVLEIQTYDMFRLEANQTHITTLRTPLKEWSAFEALASLPHLQYLQVSFSSQQSVGSRVKLSQLKTLYLESYLVNRLFYEQLDLPSLHTLFLNNVSSKIELSLIQRYLPHIRALGLDEFGVKPRPSNPSAPHLTSFICREPFSAYWQPLSCAISLKSIEEVHLSLEGPMLRRSLAQKPGYRYSMDLSNMFAHMEDESVMPKLSYVYTDLTINTLRILIPELESQLRKWLTTMKERGVMVMTYIKTSKYASHRYYSLEDIWDAEPHWEFWEPNESVYENHKWEVLAYVTGRKKMTWKVNNYASECQWFARA